MSLVPEERFGNVYVYTEQDDHCENRHKGTQQQNVTHGYYGHDFHLLPWVYEHFIDLPVTSQRPPKDTPSV